MAYMPHLAPFVALAFLGACFGLVALALAAAYGLVSKKAIVWKTAIALAAAGLGLYALLLFGSSLLSQTVVLAAGQHKYFCELDCHIAYSVDSVTTAPAVGISSQQITPQGTFYVVRLRTWFDPSTISAHRGNSPLVPNPRRVVVEDAAGRVFQRDTAAEAMFARTGVSSTPLDEALRPGESYSTTLIFDLPADARDARLLVTDNDPVTSILIGHELSPLHAKIFFALVPQASR